MARAGDGGGGATNMCEPDGKSGKRSRECGLGTRSGLGERGGTNNKHSTDDPN